jgi:L-iditol 2-dehydrogenase
MYKKAIFFNKLGKAVYKEIHESDIYLPTQYEQQKHGVNVITHPLGDPEEDEIQVEAVVGAVCTHEVSIFNGELTVPRFPWLAGHEAVHRVIKAGKGVKDFKEGDMVSCCWYHGQWSRQISGPAASAYHLPDNLGDPALWIVEPVASIVNAVGYFDIKPGDRVLLIGAGFMGLLMIQLLSHYPLSELVITEVKKYNKDIALKCGAMQVIDVSTPEGSGKLEKLGEKPFNIVVDCSGSQAGLDTAVKLTCDAGTICLFGWHRKPRMIDLSIGHLRGQRILNTSPGIDFGKRYERHWPTTIKLIERGIFNLKPLITHKYDAGEIEKAMKESTVRPEGFIKSVILFE